MQSRAYEGGLTGAPGRRGVKGKTAAKALIAAPSPAARDLPRSAPVMLNARKQAGRESQLDSTGRI